MLRLLLLRHAKSSWDDAGIADIDRPLVARGRRAATLIGEHLANHQLVPERILCSVALRTRETLACMLPKLAAEMSITVTGDLYDAPAAAYRRAIRTMGGTARTLLIVGHNPATQEIADSLIGSGSQELREAIRLKYPTAALTVIDFNLRSWDALEAGQGRVVAFFRPRDLGLVGADEVPGDDD